MSGSLTNFGVDLLCELLEFDCVCCRQQVLVLLFILEGFIVIISTIRTLSAGALF